MHLRKSVLAASLALLALTAGACANYPKAEQTPQQSTLTFGMVKSRITKGQTTQDEILKMFGSPNIVTKNKANDEVWNYNRMAYKAASGADSTGVLFWSGARAMSTTTTESFDLIIIFDNDDVVKDYSVVSAKF